MFNYYFSTILFIEFICLRTNVLAISKYVPHHVKHMEFLNFK